MSTIHQEDMDTATTTPTATKTIAVREIELRTKSRNGPLPVEEFYLQFSVGDVVRSTDVDRVDDNWNFWDENMFFDADDLFVFNVDVYQKGSLERDALVARLTSTVGGIQGELTDDVFEEEIDSPDHSDIQSTKITFILTAESREDIDAEEHQAAYITAKANKKQAFETTWRVLLQRMTLFNEMFTNIDEIHLYMSLALSVILAAEEVVTVKKHHDDRVVRLAGMMSHGFIFVHDIEPLKTVEAHIKTIVRLVQQVTECGYFITAYAKRRGFRLWRRHRTFHIDDMLTNYENKLQELHTALLGGFTLQTGITVVRMIDEARDSGEDIGLSNIPYAPGAGYVQKKGCLSGTRERVLRDICDTLNNPADDVPRVCLLTGVAGSGKSAIAHTVAWLYDEQERLGSSYFFSRSDVARRNPGNTFSTIACDLSNRDPHYKSAISRVLENNQAPRTSTWPSEQVEKLIIEPSADLFPIGPLVVVIDAIDEGGDPDNRSQLLNALSRHIIEQRLPTNLRFFIAARAENDIPDALCVSPHVIRMHLGDVPDAIIDKDIMKFVYHSLSQYTELDSSWPNGDWCRLLVRHSQHLFQWAATSCRFIRGHDSVCERLRILLRNDNSQGDHPLDRLYWTILEQQVGLCGVQLQFHGVMAVILVLKESLPLNSLSALFANGLKVQEVIRCLTPLLDDVHEEWSIHLIHVSFHDFLLDETCSLAYYIHIVPDHSLLLGQALLTCMQDMLESSASSLKDCQPSTNAADAFPHLMNVVVPPHLSYSCQYWMNHLQHATCTPELLNKVTLFFKGFFPYWLEVISFLSLSSPLPFIQSAQETCTLLMLWAKGQEIATLALKASQFIHVFVPPLRELFSHLFPSTMSQVPSNSSPICLLWFQHFQKQFQTTSQHIASEPVGQLEEVHTLEGHTDFVRSVGYSPCGRHIISGSWDKTIRVWDVNTGESAVGPFHGDTFLVESICYSPDGKYIVIGCSDKSIRVSDAFIGHTKPIKSVAYSLNGKHIVSGALDNTIRAWDVATEQCIAGPFHGHTDIVNSVVYSPNGKYIVSGSHDYSVIVWDATTGQCKVGPFQGHTYPVNSVAYSPDGRHIVSGSQDTTIRIWDVDSGSCVAGPFWGHTKSICSVAYSPNGWHIVSGSQDHSVRIWNAATGQCEASSSQVHTHYVTSIAYSPNGKQIVSGSWNKTARAWDVEWILGPFKGHSKQVFSVTYSPDGKHVVSGSEDKTIRVWNAATGQCMASPFQGHTDAVKSIAYSPDGKYVVSGSWDNTLRIWDAIAGYCMAGPFKGHTKAITSVAYSPDGKHIVSGSQDKTIRIWSATTGQCVMGPLQRHRDIVFCVAYSPDGKHIVSGSEDKTIMVWNAATGQCIVGPLEKHTNTVLCVTYSPDGKHIASGSCDNTIMVWGVTTGQCVLGPLEGYTQYVRSVDYSPDGAYIVSGSVDQTIRVWNAITGQCIAGPFQEHTSIVTSVAYSPNGMHIVSGSDDKTIRIWDPTTGQCVVGPDIVQSTVS